MQSRYSLIEFIDAVEKLAELHGMSVATYEKNGRAVAFKLYIKGEDTPTDVFTVATTPEKEVEGRKVRSIEDISKPAERINGASQQEFQALLEGVKPHPEDD